MAHNTEEQVEKNWKEFKKSDEIDPRAIRRQHRFKLGHEPGYAEPESGVTYLNVKFEGEPVDPDQLDKLHGGPESGVPCTRCQTITTICGETTTWDIMNQENVSLVDRESVTPARQKELEAEVVVILCCPQCQLKYQWLAEFLPGKVDASA